MVRKLAMLTIASLVFTLTTALAWNDGLDVEVERVDKAPHSHGTGAPPPSLRPMP